MDIGDAHITVDDAHMVAEQHHPPAQHPDQHADMQHLAAEQHVQELGEQTDAISALLAAGQATDPNAFQPGAAGDIAGNAQVRLGSLHHCSLNGMTESSSSRMPPVVPLVRQRALPIWACASCRMPVHRAA